MPKRTSDFREGLLADLADPIEAANYLNAAFEDSERMALVALRDVAEARQMAKVAKEAGVAREALYRMLSESGNPTLGNLSAILKSVGLKIEVTPIGLPSHRRLRITRKKHVTHFMHAGKRVSAGKKSGGTGSAAIFEISRPPKTSVYRGAAADVVSAHRQAGMASFSVNREKDADQNLMGRTG